MKIKFGKATSDRVVSRLKKKARIRKRVAGTPERPRLCVFRSATHIYAQIIDDANGTVLGAASSLKLKKSGNCDTAKEVGGLIAKVASEKNIDTVVFDRNGFLYHGRVKALADGAREAGLKF